MNGKDVERLQGHGVVAAEHILVAKQVGEIGGQGLSHGSVLDFGNPAATQFQPQQLPRVEQLPIAMIAPTMKAFSFIPLGDGIIRGKMPCFICRTIFQRGELGQILFVGSFKEPPLALASGQGFRQVILYREKPVSEIFAVWVGDGFVAVKAPCFSSGCGVFL